MYERSDDALANRLFCPMRCRLELRWENPFIGANTVEAVADEPLKLERRITAGHNNMCDFSLREASR